MAVRYSRARICASPARRTADRPASISRRDQAGVVEVLQVGFILRPEAGKLHANQIRQRNQTDAMEHPNRAR